MKPILIIDSGRIFALGRGLLLPGDVYVDGKIIELTGKTEEERYAQLGNILREEQKKAEVSIQSIAYEISKCTTDVAYLKPDDKKKKQPFWKDLGRNKRKRTY